MPQKQLKELRVPSAGGSRDGLEPRLLALHQGSQACAALHPGQNEKAPVKPFAVPSPFPSPKKLILYFIAWDIASREKKGSVF